MISMVTSGSEAFTKTQSNPMKLRIRPMELQDLEQVVTIDQMSFTMPWPLSAYTFELNENPGSLLLVAETLNTDPTGCSETQQIVGKPRIIGLIVLWLILDEAHIATIAVHPDYRGRGVARLMLIKALEEAVRRGADQATLEVRINNVAAQKLYYRFGFEVVGHRPRYYRDNNEDALIMTVNHLGEEYLAWLKNSVYTPG